MITKYKIFLETRFADILKINPKSNAEIAGQFSKIKDAEYDSTKTPIRFITLRHPIDGKQAGFRIHWYDTDNHNIQSRIMTRTSLKSVDEFNDILKDVMNKIFPDMIGNEVTESGKYSIYVSEYGFTIILGIDVEKYNRRDFSVMVVTILPGRKAGGSLIEV